MTKVAFLLTLLSTVLVCLLPAAPALALVARTFVSAAGSDSNNCANVITPCRHLATAYAATAANGEIYVLDPANYGSLTITGPVSIEGHGWASIAPVANGNAITINAPGATDKINIIVVVLDGTALAGTNGIVFNSGGSLNVQDSVIRNFTEDGIFFAPGASSQLFVSNTLLSDNGGEGINIIPEGSGTTNAVIDHVKMQNNGASGLRGLVASQTINITVSDSVSASNGSAGIFAQSGGAGGTLSFMVRNCSIVNNGADGLQTFATGATIRVTRSTITANATGWVNSGGGVVLGYGDNNIDGNTSVNTEPPNPLTYN
jgi:hypothetical protein